MRILFVTLVYLLMCGSLIAAPLIAPPQIGDAAPDFELTASDGKAYQLSQFRGKQQVVIAFFPKAFTGG